ncbi:hypothetical protein U9M48_044482 [Paspalum notatum var. saurae]|uniref:Uncharacterized protein n=1 Tax=Paspalum notatum var. saurae TaxID=547442 RepID=A0AAQ3UVQ9_PASNO
MRMEVAAAAVESGSGVGVVVEAESLAAASSVDASLLPQAAVISVAMWVARMVGGNAVLVFSASGCCIGAAGRENGRSRRRWRSWDGRLLGGVDKTKACHIKDTLVPLLKQADVLWVLALIKMSTTARSVRMYDETRHPSSTLIFRLWYLLTIRRYGLKEIHTFVPKASFWGCVAANGGVAGSSPSQFQHWILTRCFWDALAPAFLIGAG